MRRHKYGAQATTVDGIRFASKREAARYSELKLLEKAGEIRELELQPRLELLAPLPVGHALVDRRLACVGAYVADFAYIETASGEKIIEDAKGVRTPLYRWKRRHVRVQYGIEIREV